MNTNESNKSDTRAQRRTERLGTEAVELDANQAGFGPVIHAYTRAQALFDGFQIDVSNTAKEAGIRFPAFMTRTVWDAYVTVPAGVACQDEAGRLWDIVWVLRAAIRQAPAGQTRIDFQLRVRNDDRQSRLVTLAAECGPLDINDPTPAITIMMPDED